MPPGTVLGMSTEPSTQPDAEPVDQDTPHEPAGLTDRQLAILDLERSWWKYAGAKEQAVGDTFGVSSTRYYQELNALIDHPAALASDPLLVRRLRRLRAARQRQRSARRLGFAEVPR